MTWIVTGGAGFIGAHVVHLLHRQHKVVVFDDLSTGRPDRLPADVTVVKGSVTDHDQLDRLFRDFPARGVIHLAARKVASESVHDPQLYWRDNVDGVRHVVAAMRQARVHRLLFASSAAVYGDTGGEAVHEKQMPRPSNPYGMTKLAGERIISRAGGVRMRSLTFRQFNVVGAGDHRYAADTGPTSLLPAIFHAMTDGPDLTIRGIDYPTFDGSAIRDYVHVSDVAQAYLKGVEYLSRHGFSGHRHKVVNVGSGVGNSVFEVVRIASEVAHISVPYQVGPRRLGDAAAVVADVTRARRFLGPGQLSLTDAIASAWASWQKDVTVESYR